MKNTSIPYVAGKDSCFSSAHKEYTVFFGYSRMCFHDRQRNQRYGDKENQQEKRAAQCRKTVNSWRPTQISSGKQQGSMTALPSKAGEYEDVNAAAAFMSISVFGWFCAPVVHENHFQIKPW